MTRFYSSLSLMTVTLMAMVLGQATADERAATAGQNPEASESRVVKVKTKTQRSVKRRKGSGSDRSGVSAETMRRLDELLLLDALRNARR